MSPASVSYDLPPNQPLKANALRPPLRGTTVIRTEPMAKPNEAEQLLTEGDEIIFKHVSELRATLRKIDSRLPRRTKGRRSHHRERYSIVRYLNALAETSHLSFPLRVVKSESPDFLLYLPSELVGVEVTEVGTEKHQQAMTQLERSAPGTVLEGESDLRGPGESLRGLPSIGDEPERQVARLIVEAQEAKTKKLNEAHFRTADRYELLIYENTQFIPDLEDLAPIVREALTSWRSETPAAKHFTKTSILLSATLLYDCTGAGLGLQTTRGL